MKVKVKQETIYRWYVELTGNGLGWPLPDFIELEAEPLQESEEKCRYNCTNEIAFGGCPIHTPGACMPPKEIKLPEKIDLNIIEDNSRVADLLLAQKINEIIDYLS
jgi:hypothetical protein